ncbi:MAG: VCBS repeat-containing protein, partial [Chloroflexi bacterium]|nr:VCBS repeat-containing protein [Chloroflexota bacterium]
MVVAIVAMLGQPSAPAAEPAIGYAADASYVAETGDSLVNFLKAFGKAFQQLDVDALLELHDDDYFNEEEGVWTEQLRSSHDGVRVYAWRIDNPQAFHKADIRSQAEPFCSRFASIDEADFKLASIEQLSDGGPTEIISNWRFRATTKAGEVYESYSTFRIWLTNKDQKWKVVRKQLVRGQSVVGPGKGFTDIAVTAGLDFGARHNPQLDLPEWEPTSFGIMRYASAGVATADFDNDGWYDIFFADGSQPRLYRNDRDGTFTDVTDAVGLPHDLQGTNVALFADLDNDGDKDLFLGRLTGNNRLFRNDDGTFTDVTTDANIGGGPWVTTAAIADYDNDGLLDIFVGRYLDPRKNIPSLFFYTRNGEGSTLLRNLGNLRFEDATKRAGVRDTGLTLGLQWADYDKDGDQDVYLANDFGRNALFRNNGDGTFTNVAKPSGTIDI